MGMAGGSWLRCLGVAARKILNAREGRAGAVGPRLFYVWLWSREGLYRPFRWQASSHRNPIPHRKGGEASDEASTGPYWQASQSGSSMAQAFGTGAGPAAWTGALSPPLDTALSLPVLMVDFSVLVAARARR